MRSHNIVTIRHLVDAQLFADIMIIATTEAIDGWADIVVFNQTEDPAMYKMEILEDKSPEPGEHHTVTGATIMLGMQRIIDLELPAPVPNNSMTTMSQIRAWIIESVSDGDACMIDAYCADAIIQFALFNEQIYS